MAESKHEGVGRFVLVCAGVALVLVALLVASSQAQAQPGPSIEQVNADLGVGVNLGNALEADREGDWGVTLDAEYFDEIAAAGFDHVRVPIKWSAYADERAPFTIPQTDDPSIPYAANIWERVDWVIDQAESAGLHVIINVHHYDELHEDPTGHRNRFLAIWGQIAARYADAPPSVLFELLNEPNDTFNREPERWNEMFADALAIVRQTNPDRAVLAAPVEWNGVPALDDLELPDDPNLIVSIHFYEPFWFSHQGAEWIDPTPPTPVSWDPDVIGIGATWENWSWDVAWTPTQAGSAVTFGRQWSGLQFERGRQVDPVSLEFTVSGVAELDVRCVHEEGVPTDLKTVVTSAQVTTYLIDLTPCPSETSRFVLMNSGPIADQLLFTDMVFCSTNLGCEPVIETAQASVHSMLDRAAAWGEANDRPINIGEFGIYGAEGRADLAQRATWTAIVRARAQANNMSVSYWEFGAGFGVYDRTTNAWVEPLLDALLPNTAASGDSNCDGAMDLSDVAVTAQLATGARTDVGQCPLFDSSAQGNGQAADLDGDGATTIVDALLIAACVGGLVDTPCPA